MADNDKGLSIIAPANMRVMKQRVSYAVTLKMFH